MGTYQKGDERIVGDSNFVEEVLSQANERLEQKYRMSAKGLSPERLTERVAELTGMTVAEVMDSGKDRRSSKARSILC